MAAAIVRIHEHAPAVRAALRSVAS
jgi:hypothetical protein